MHRKFEGPDVKAVKKLLLTGPDEDERIRHPGSPPALTTYEDMPDCHPRQSHRFRTYTLLCDL